jgi:hypothetical protein
VNATEGGKNAILALAGGDLRRVLNLLQSTAMAYPQVGEICVAWYGTPAVCEGSCSCTVLPSAQPVARSGI